MGIFKKSDSDKAEEEEVRREVEKMVRSGYLLDVDGRIYPTALSDFLAEYEEKVEKGLIEPGKSTWERLFISFVRERSKNYIILKHRAPLDSFEKWL